MNKTLYSKVKNAIQKKGAYRIEINRQCPYDSDSDLEMFKLICFALKHGFDIESTNGEQYILIHPERLLKYVNGINNPENDRTMFSL